MAAVISIALIILSTQNLGGQFKGIGSLGSNLMLSGTIVLTMIGLVRCCRKKEDPGTRIPIEMTDGYYHFDQQSADEASQILMPEQQLPCLISKRRYVLTHNTVVADGAISGKVIDKSFIERFINLPTQEVLPNSKGLSKYRKILRSDEIFRCINKDGKELVCTKEGQVAEDLYRGNGIPRRFEVIKLRYENQIKNGSWGNYFRSLIS